MQAARMPLGWGPYIITNWVQGNQMTLEANPATFDVDKARLFSELGVSRVSLGIQSFTPHVLETLKKPC